jgi:hypothetical protein
MGMDSEEPHAKAAEGAKERETPKAIGRKQRDRFNF